MTKKEILKNLKIRLHEKEPCDYCGDRPATGIVMAYESIVCEDCYHDHHG